MNQKDSTLLRLIHGIEPDTTEKYGLMIPYWKIHQSAERCSLYINDNMMDAALVHLKKENALEIIHDPDCNGMILGVHIK